MTSDDDIASRETNLPSSPFDRRPVISYFGGPLPERVALKKRGKIVLINVFLQIVACSVKNLRAPWHE